MNNKGDFGGCEPCNWECPLGNPMVNLQVQGKVLLLFCFCSVLYCSNFFTYLDLWTTHLVTRGWRRPLQSCGIYHIDSNQKVSVAVIFKICIVLEEIE